MEEKVDDSEATPAATATTPKQSSSSSSSLPEFFEESCAKRGASSEDDKHTTNSGISSKASSSSGAENWANFELVTISASSTISFDRPPPSSNDCSSSTSFVVFESSWRAWLLGGNQTFNGNISTVSSVLVDDDDGWMSQLLPLRHHQERQQHANHHPKIPPLQRNPRDCTIHHRFQADPGLLFERSGFSHYHHYQAAYVANATSSETSNFDSEHHLSNEEWIAQRRRRDGDLRRRYQQEVERMLGLEQVVFSSSPEDTRNRTNLDQHQQRFVRRIVADGQTLLSIDPQSENDASSSGTMDSEEHSSRPTGPETPSSSSVHSLSPSPSPTRPTQRFRARRLPITSQARREQFQHWSSSAVQRSLDVVLVPWRMVFRNDEENTNNRNVDNHIALGMAEDGDRSFSDDTSGRAISSDANSISQGDEALNELPPWPSGRGWRPGQNDDSDGDDDARNGDSDESTGGTGYWSTGTAMETDYESSSLSVSIACHDHSEVDEEWEDGLMQFPSVEEEDPHQYEFMPTPEDPLFPDDPFSESF